MSVSISLNTGRTALILNLSCVACVIKCLSFSCLPILPIQYPRDFSVVTSAIKLCPKSQMVEKTSLLEISPRTHAIGVVIRAQSIARVMIITKCIIQKIINRPARKKTFSQIYCRYPTKLITYDTIQWIQRKQQGKLQLHEKASLTGSCSSSKLGQHNMRL